MNHYEYCEAVLEAFWKLVFGKTPDEMWCGGIVSCHGDKCYGYREEWEVAGIPFKRGVLLYMLTYTEKLGETPKHASGQWVIASYQTYLEKILAAEKEAGINITDVL